MLDAAACCQTRLAAEPATSLSALTALRILLLEAMRTAAAEEPSDAGIASPNSYRGDRHAAPLSPAPTAAPSTRSLVGNSAAGIGGAPRWSALPDQTQRTLASLLTRLLMAHPGAADQELGEPSEGDGDER